MLHLYSFRLQLLIPLLLVLGLAACFQSEPPAEENFELVPQATELSVINQRLLNDKAEVGKLSISQRGKNDWVTVTLKQSYVEPVVIMQPLSYNGSDPSTVRLKNVSTESFQVQIDEWDYRDGGHIAEDVSYIVAEKGDLNIGGMNLRAGKVDVNHNWKTVSLDSKFANTPVVLSQSQTVNGGAAVVTRQRNVSKSSFELRLQEEEAADGIHYVESVGYIAFEKIRKDGVEAKTLDSVTHTWKNVSFANSYSESIFLAGMQTYNGSDPATIRYRNLDANSAQIKVEEEKSRDTEIGHANETVGVVMIEGDDSILSLDQQAFLDGITDITYGELLTVIENLQSELRANPNLSEEELNSLAFDAVIQQAASQLFSTQQLDWTVQTLPINELEIIYLTDAISSNKFFRVLDLMTMTAYAKIESTKRYNDGESRELQGFPGLEDAFRHTYWNLIFAASFDLDTAAKWTFAHECFGGEPNNGTYNVPDESCVENEWGVAALDENGLPLTGSRLDAYWRWIELDIKMDLINNEIGRELSFTTCSHLGSVLRNGTAEEFGDCLQDFMENSEELTGLKATVLEDILANEYSEYQNDPLVECQDIYLASKGGSTRVCLIPVEYHPDFPNFEHIKLRGHTEYQASETILIDDSWGLEPDTNYIISSESTWISHLDSTISSSRNGSVFNASVECLSVGDFSGEVVFTAPNGDDVRVPVDLNCSDYSGERALFSPTISVSCQYAEKYTLQHNIPSGVIRNTYPVGPNVFSGSSRGTSELYTCPNAPASLVGFMQRNADFNAFEVYTLDKEDYTPWLTPCPGRSFKDGWSIISCRWPE